MAPRGLKTKNAAKNIARAHTYAIFSGCAEPIDTGAGQVRGRCGAGAGQVRGSDFGWPVASGGTIIKD